MRYLNLKPISGLIRGLGPAKDPLSPDDERSYRRTLPTWRTVVKHSSSYGSVDRGFERPLSLFGPVIVSSRPTHQEMTSARGLPANIGTEHLSQNVLFWLETIILSNRGEVYKKDSRANVGHPIA